MHSDFRGSPIPISNIYYLLCYAWNRLPEGEIIDVSGIDSNELVDLFASVLINGMNHILRRGLERGYQQHCDELMTIRGRIDVASTTRRMLMIQGKAQCDFDEFTVNTLSNKFIKSTIRFLYYAPNLDRKLKAKLHKLNRELWEIDDIPLNKFVFRKVQLNSNNRFYRFLLNVCEMVQSSWLVDEQKGTYKFRDFIRDDKAMARLYENFILNFFKNETKDIDARKEKIKWNASSDTDPALSYLPSMETDISLRSAQKTLIIDAKYYSRTFQKYYDKESIHSGNIFQIMAYLDNIQLRGGNDSNAEGMLLYPVVDSHVSETYKMNGKTIHIKTIDLGANWRDIRNDLLEIASLVSSRR